MEDSICKWDLIPRRQAKLNYVNMAMQYTEIYKVVTKVKIFSKSVFLYIYIFLIFAQNIDCGYTHNLCFEAKIRKIGILLQTPVFLYKSGVQGVYFSWPCFPNGCSLTGYLTYSLSFL